ncbi:MAG: hypothetical protein MN733_02410 [Nitrososphaera sp.]|nr:hypothetical protein [Nitrososphaera sp.]
MEIKPMSLIGKKWNRNAKSAGPSYQEGVRAPRRSWAAATEAADEARKAGLIEADQRDAFRAGVRNAGDQKWKRNAEALGPGRFSQGVANAQPDYESGFAKSHGILSALQLPERGPKGDPSNIDRVAIIAAALHAGKNS